MDHAPYLWYILWTMLHRILKPLLSNSFFMFGPRGTGKTTFLKNILPPKEHLWIQLLDPVEEDRLSRNPMELQDRAKSLVGPNRFVVIDEIQKVPKLLDVVHHLIETTTLTFAMTGSSSRKLKRGAANLLAGRAFVNHLHPITHVEFGHSFDLYAVLHWGALPKLMQLHETEEKMAFLQAYAFTYLKEEIWGEQIIRKLDPFRAFLPIAAQCNGEPLNYSKMAREVGVDNKTIQSYFQILEDTLIGFLLPAYHPSVRKQQRHSPKFYFFDLGVKRVLDGTLVQPPIPHTFGFGKLFEHFLILEILRLNDYYKKDFRPFYLRNQDGSEIDLILERPGMPLALIEIKSSNQITSSDLKTLERMAKDFHQPAVFCLSLDPHPKKIGSVDVLPWQEGIQKIFGNATH